MSSVRYVYWQDRGMWLGYLEEFPDYWTQGATMVELHVNLRDLFGDLSCGVKPGIRRVAELEIE